MSTPDRIDLRHQVLAPAVFLTWGTDGIASHPGETFGAASGYFISPSLVMTVRHVGQMIENELRREGVPWNAESKFRPFCIQVHDPRTGLSWEVVSLSDSPAADLALLTVEPVLIGDNIADHFSEFARTFLGPAHRTRRLEIGESVAVKGFTEIAAILDYDHTPQGSHRQIRVSAYGQVAVGHIGELHPTGKLGRQWPTFDLEGVGATGQMSGGPVVDSDGYIVGVISSSLDKDTITSVVDWPTIIANNDYPVANDGSCLIRFDGMAYKVLHVTS